MCADRRLVRGCCVAPTDGIFKRIPDKALSGLFENNDRSVGMGIERHSTQTSSSSKATTQALTMSTTTTATPSTAATTAEGTRAAPEMIARRGEDVTSHGAPQQGGHHLAARCVVEARGVALEAVSGWRQERARQRRGQERKDANTSTSMTIKNVPKRLLYSCGRKRTP